MSPNRGLTAALLTLAAVSVSQRSVTAQEPRMEPAQARAALASASPTERAIAACHLGRMTADEVRPAREQLLAMLTDDTPVEGRLCRDYNQHWGGEQDESTPGREAAIALEELGAEVLDPLLDVLEGPNAAGRENAALGLGLIEDPRAVPALSAALSEDRVAEVRARSAWSLGLIEHPDAVAALSNALRNDTDGDTRGQSAWALGMIEDPAGVPSLLDSFDDAVVEVRSQAAWALGMIEHPSGVPGLNRAIDDTDAEVRSQAAWALGMIESPEGVDPLVQALDDSDAKVRGQAAWGLGMIESNRATSDLIRTLRADRDAEVRSQTAWALGMIEDPDATEALLEAIEDEDPDVQQQAMWALSRVLRTGGFSRVDRSELAAKLRRALGRDPESGAT